MTQKHEEGKERDHHQGQLDQELLKTRKDGALGLRHNTETGSRPPGLERMFLLLCQTPQDVVGCVDQHARKWMGTLIDSGE